MGNTNSPSAVNLSKVLNRYDFFSDGSPPPKLSLSSNHLSCCRKVLGGGWCDTIRNFVYRKTSRHGSSKYMDKNIPFTGILSDQSAENPDFYNWTRVKVRYCVGGYFSGDSENKVS
ncbi:unnamed protein product [Eruca vesicaria subsp. sativa]|uniref:Pectin acetylesterase n=1 Tax=Eruca vesicaria subsp. sativa TaxID=29727 RepID=A0ABC8JNZ4_ERUVS|nr:unnamed protein product [Eruca vesicaria subsp. sativa]